MTTLVNVPIEYQTIDNTKSNKYWLAYFRKSYEEFNGVSTSSMKKQFYTLEEQIERYSTNLAYWYIQLEMDKKESNVKYLKDVQPKDVFIKSQIVRLMNIIRNIFPSNITPLIHQQAIDIKHNTLKEYKQEYFTPPEVVDIINKMIEVS